MTGSIPILEDKPDLIFMDMLVLEESQGSSLSLHNWNNHIAAYTGQNWWNLNIKLDISMITFIPFTVLAWIYVRMKSKPQKPQHNNFDWYGCCSTICYSSSDQSEEISGDSGQSGCVKLPLPTLGAFLTFLVCWSEQTEMPAEIGVRRKIGHQHQYRIQIHTCELVTFKHG